jgi:ABC exporter DevB family membrane fusion protein
MKNNSLLFFSAIILICLFLTLPAAGRAESLPAGDNAAVVVPAKLGPIVTVYAYGVVAARKHSTLSAKFPGKLEKILVREGERVTKGQLLALFEARDLEAQVRVARSGVEVARVVLAEARAGSRPQELTAAQEQEKETEALLAKARLDWERYQQLLADTAVAKTDWEQVRIGLEVAEARRNEAVQHRSLLEEGTRPESITVLEKRLHLAEAELDYAEANLANSRLTAPFDGVITRKHREEGEAMDIGQPVMDIATLDQRYVRTEIDETDIGRVKTGQQAQVTADGFPGLVFNGTVMEIKKQMGPKLVIPSDPAKIIDYKVLDVEVSLPPDCPFPLMLPVNVRISLK